MTTFDADVNGKLLSFKVEGLTCHNNAMIGIDAYCDGFARLIVEDTLEFSSLGELWELQRLFSRPIQRSLDRLAQEQAERDSRP